VDGQHGGLGADDTATLVGARIDGGLDGQPLSAGRARTLPISAASSASLS